MSSAKSPAARSAPPRSAANTNSPTACWPAGRPSMPNAARPLSRCACPYMRLPVQFVYLAAVLAAYPCRCVGWALSREITITLTLAALEQAGAQIRMAARGCPTESAQAECVFRTLKYNVTHPLVWWQGFTTTCSRTRHPARRLE